MGGLLAYLGAELTAAIRRKSVVFGLMAAGGLIAIFAAGYALDAVYSMLAFRLGAPIASLIIAGALVVVAIGCVVAARTAARQPDASTEQPARYRAPLPRPYSRQRVVAVVAAFAGAASTGIALMKFRMLRSLLRGRRR